MDPRATLQQALYSRRPSEPVGVWLGRVLDALPADAEADEQIVAELAQAVNGPLAEEQRRIEEDSAAHVDFWRTVAERLPSHPHSHAMYADTLLLTGDTEAARREMLAALEADPTIVYRMSGEYRDVMERAGGADWAAYRALVLRAADIDDPDGNRDYVMDGLRDLLSDVGDDAELRRTVMRILGRPKDRAE